jgi:hypothetical protein
MRFHRLALAAILLAFDAQAAPREIEVAFEARNLQRSTSWDRLYIEGPKLRLTGRFAVPEGSGPFPAVPWRALSAQLRDRSAAADGQTGGSVVRGLWARARRLVPLAPPGTAPRSRRWLFVVTNATDLIRHLRDEANLFNRSCVRTRAWPKISHRIV